MEAGAGGLERPEFKSFAMKSLLLLLVFFGIVGVQAQKSRMLPDYSDHECIRTCEDGGEPMVCRYDFVIETYETMSKACYECASGNVTDCLRGHCITANGFVRNVLSVNRIVPGPTIQVCEGDTVIVDVDALMSMTEGVGIHWHGILQKDAQHMDGVPMITQCPITSGTFQYRFHIEDEGTHLWHAHAGVQRGDGMFGSFVVRQPPSLEPHFSLYDFDLPEHVIVLNEWTDQPMDEVFAINNMGNAQTSGFSAILINGRAEDTTGVLTLPKAVFNVQAGYRYRFRVISAGFLFCPLRISVDDHSLLLIASDGKPFVPFEVGSIDMLSAERYDFVLTALRENGSFWLRATGLGACEATGVEGLAVIQYVTQDDNSANSGDLRLTDTLIVEPEKTPAPEIKGKIFSYWDFPPRPVPTKAREQKDEPNLSDSRSQILSMDALAEDDDALLKKPDHQFILELSLNAVNNLHLFDPDLYPANSGPYTTASSPQINGISNKLGPVPLLSQMDEIPEGQICNSSALGDNCIGDWCECNHLLTVNLNDIVEMVITSPIPATTFIHPFHTHGFSFRVVAIDRLTEVMTPALFRELDEQGLIERKLHLAPFKDTVALPDGGFVVIRFKADNPGVWFMHCHLLFHAELGMAIAMEVLNENGTLPPPPEGFPRCGPFALPEEYEQESETNTAYVDSALSSHRQVERDSDDKARTHFSTSKRYGTEVNQRRSHKKRHPRTPSWVLPVIVSLSVAVAGLAVFSFALWRQQIRRNRLDVWRSQAYNRNEGEKGWDPNDTDEALFVSSKKQELLNLTR